MARRTARTQTESQALEETPEFIKNFQGEKGTEDLGAQEVQMPRLGLAQSNSWELIEGHARYIPDLDQGEFFNSITKQIYGKKVEVALLRILPPVWMEFAPMEQGGGLIDPNVPEGDPRTRFGSNGEKPAAQQLFNYFVHVVGGPPENVAVMTLKSTGVKIAKALNSLLKFGFDRRPIFGWVLEVEVTRNSVKNHTWYAPQFARGRSVTEEEFFMLGTLFDLVKEREAPEPEPGSVDE